MRDSRNFIPEENQEVEIENREEKKIYKPPELVVHGTIADITRDTSFTGPRDAFIGFELS